MVVILPGGAGQYLLPRYNRPHKGQAPVFSPHLLCALAFCRYAPLQSPKPSPGLPHFVGYIKVPSETAYCMGAPGRSDRGYTGFCVRYPPRNHLSFRSSFP
jgi:hypothetical protein